MNNNRAIDELRSAFFGAGNNAGDTFYATVESVDESARTCSVTTHEATFEDVLLHAVTDASIKGFCMIPATGSVVLVSRIGGSNELLVSLFSDIDRVLLTIGDKVEASIDDKELTYVSDKVSLKINGENVELNAEKVVFNGGDNKGMVKIQELTDKINALVDAHNSHTHTLMSGTVAVAGSATSQSNLAPITVPAITAKAQKLNKADYENEKVKH